MPASLLHSTTFHVHIPIIHCSCYVYLLMLCDSVVLRFNHAGLSLNHCGKASGFLSYRVPKLESQMYVSQ